MTEYQAILNIAGSVFIVWAALVGVASVIVHLRVWDRHSAMSTHLLGYMGAVALVLVLSCIKIFTGDSWWFQLLRLITFIGIPIMMSHRLKLQICAQRAARGGGDHSPADTPDKTDRPAE